MIICDFSTPSNFSPLFLTIWNSILFPHRFSEEISYAVGYREFWKRDKYSDRSQRIWKWIVFLSKSPQPVFQQIPSFDDGRTISDLRNILKMPIWTDFRVFFNISSSFPQNFWKWNSKHRITHDLSNSKHWKRLQSHEYRWSNLHWKIKENPFCDGLPEMLYGEFSVFFFDFSWTFPQTFHKPN